MNLAVHLIAPFNSIRTSHSRTSSENSVYSSEMTENSNSNFSTSPSSTTVPLFFDYTVKSESETLRSLAVRFDITLAELRQTNRLSSFDTIFKGKTLKIPNVHNYSFEKFQKKYQSDHEKAISKNTEKRNSIHDLLNTDLLSFQTSNLTISESHDSKLSGKGQTKSTSKNDQFKSKIEPENSSNNQSIEEDAGFIKTRATLLPTNIPGSLIITDSALMFDPDDRTNQDLAVINPLSEIAWMECSKYEKSTSKNNPTETEKKLEAEFGWSNSLLRSISDYLLDDGDSKAYKFLLLKMSISVEFQYFEISSDCTNKVFNLLSDAKNRETGKLVFQECLNPPESIQKMSSYSDFRASINQENMQTNWFLQNKQNVQQVQKNYDRKSNVPVKPEFPGLVDHDYVVIKETNNSFEFPSIENFDEEYILPDLKATDLKGKNPSAGDDIGCILSDLDSGEVRNDKNFHLKVLTKWLPDSVAGVSMWRLIFDSEKHGHSLASIYRICDREKRRQTNNVLIIESVDGDYFGAFLTELPHPVEPHAVYKHYGSGESFLFSLNGSKSRKFSWTSANNFIATGDSEHFAVGGGRGTHGIWFDAKLCEGSSQACDTFGNEDSIAGGKRDFIVSSMQLWVLE